MPFLSTARYESLLAALATTQQEVRDLRQQTDALVADMAVRNAQWEALVVHLNEMAEVLVATHSHSRLTQEYLQERRPYIVIPPAGGSYHPA